MLGRGWIIALIVTGVALVGSGCNETGDRPLAVTKKFYQRLEKFDTAGMMELVCRSEHDSIDSATSVLQALDDFPLSEASTGDLELVDFEMSRVESKDTSATVQVEGRLIAGTPLGSASLDEEVVLRLEGDKWCITSDPRESASE
jgi:hypothetical protein